MLSSFQANKLAYCNPTDASRRHKTPESETNDAITQSKGSSQSFRIFEFPLPLCNEQRVGWHACMPNGLGYERLLLSREWHRDSWPPEERNSIWGQWLGPSLALERDTLFFKAVCKNSVSAYKMGRNVRGSWTVVSKQLPKAYKKSSLITGNTQKMLRHLCSVDHKCRPALNLQEVMPWEQEVVINSEKVTVIFH